jgi:hypothetical protein
VIPRRKPASPEAEQKFAADQAFAARFDERLAEARVAEKELRDAEAANAPLMERYRLAKRLDTALTDATRAAFAAERVAIGPLGYEDRIYRRKAKATGPVRIWSAEAERLLTLRESHRLTGIPPVPRSPSRREAEDLAPSFQPTDAAQLRVGNRIPPAYANM